jgi:HSP20 family protein
MFDAFCRELGLPAMKDSEEPRIVLREEPGMVVVRAVLPGLSPEHIDITVTDRTLVLEGSRAEITVTAGRSMHVVRRRITLPCAIVPEKATASFRQGVLEISLPKAGECYLNIAITRE